MGNFPHPCPLPKSHVLGPFKDKRGATCPHVVTCPFCTCPHDQTFVALRQSDLYPHFPPKWMDTGLSEPSDASGYVQPHTDITGDPGQNREKLQWAQCSRVTLLCHEAKSVTEQCHLRVHGGGIKGK